MVGTSPRFDALARQLLSGLLSPLDGDARDEVVQRVVTLLEQEVRHETRRCVRLCVQRAQLWRGTPARTGPFPYLARNEARSRGNEAEYLAELLAAESV